MKKQLAFYFDSTSCSGCKACQIACKDKNNLEPGLLWRRVYEVAGGNWEQQGTSWINNVFSYNISISCNHCEKPVCLESCPTSAIIKREDGIVYIDETKCMGCRYCEWACPYEAMQFNDESGIMQKCNFCLDYIDEGKKPSCVTACPMRALDMGTPEELKEKYGNDNVFPLPNQSYTKPAYVITPHPSAKIATKENASVINEEEVSHAG